MFKAYDIRGKYGSEVTPEKFRVLGAAASAEFAKEITIGTDYRAHNAELLEAFCSGFNGEKTILGYAPSPATAFLSKKLGFSITASHNPAEYAGGKFFRNRTYCSEGEMTALKRRFETTKSGGNARGNIYDSPELMEEYLVSLPEFEGGIYDLGGGAACAISKVFPATIFSKPDPFFNGRSPEPKADTLEALRRRTIARRMVGFAFDGDADRMIPCDKGVVLEGDVAAAFIAERTLKKGDGIVLSIDCRQEVFRRLADAGFGVATSKVGDANVMRTAMEAGAAFSGERSGHFAFLRHAPNSDGIYAAATISGTKPGELAEFNRTFRNVTVIEQVFRRVDFAKLKGLVEAKGPEELVTLDGVKAVFDDYTLLIRASTTEPKVRLNSEAKTREKALAGMALAKELVAKCPG